MDSVYHRNQKENFVVFNDQPLTFESVTDADIKADRGKAGIKVRVESMELQRGLVLRGPTSRHHLGQRSHE